MNEQIVLAIVRLLAMSTKLDGVSAIELTFVRAFFTDLLPPREVPRYMALFEQYLTTASSDDAAIKDQCERLNASLTYPQKVIALIRLLEVAIADHNLSTAEQDFLVRVSNGLLLPATTLSLLLQFVVPQMLSLDKEEVSKELLYKQHWPFSHPNLLCLNGGHTDPDKGFYHHHDLDGWLLFVSIPETELLFLRPIDISGDLTLFGEHLEVNRIYALAPGSTIRKLGMPPIFQSDIVAHFRPIPQDQKIRLHAEGLWYQFGNKHWGLRDINLEAEGGQLVAIMGASGSGKSTLLSVLNGNTEPSQGHVWLNGQTDLHFTQQPIQGLVGYVPQDDLLIEELTVWENLRMAASLCFKNKPISELDELVTITLQRLGLWDSRDLRVGSALDKTISGGQRKRVNIGLELLRKPQLLFVDEPTSGLSSHDSENIVDLLRELALSGNLVFVVIHQPSSTIFKMFNKLLVLDTGGYQLFYGNPLEALVYFRTHEDLLNKSDAECHICGNVNAEEIFQIIERKEVDEYGWEQNQRRLLPQDWAAKWQAHTSKQPIRGQSLDTTLIESLPLSTSKIPNWGQQWLVFVRRNVLAKLRNKQYILLNLLQAPILALLLGGILRFDRVNDLTQTEDYIFRENMNIPVYIFVGVIVALFMGLLVSAEDIIKDRKIRKREAFLHLSWSSYLAAKMTWLFALSALQAALFVLIGNQLCGLEGLNGHYWLMLFSVSCFANLLGLNISDSFNSAITIYIMIPLMLIPQLVLGGVVVRFDNMNPHVSDIQRVPWLGELMASRWAFEGLIVNQYVNNAYQKPLFDWERKSRTAHYKAIILIDNTLISKLNDVQSSLEIPGYIPTSEVNDNLLIVRQFIDVEPMATASLRQLAKDSLLPTSLTIQSLDHTKQQLTEIKHQYLKASNRYMEERNLWLMRNYPTGAAKAQVYDHFVNDRLNDFVLDATNPDKVVQVESKLYRKFEPIHYDPDYYRHPLDFRAHFFAPRKHFLGRYYPTYTLNLAVLWVMTILLTACLYLRVGRNIGSLSRNLKAALARRRKHQLLAKKVN